MQIKKIFILPIFITLFLNCQKKADFSPSLTDPGQKKEEQKKIFWVNAKIGLRMRANPGTKSRLLDTIPFGDPVEQLDQTGDQIEIAGKRGQWWKVKWQENPGWVFSGYLSTEKINIYHSLLPGDWYEVSWFKLPQPRQFNFSAGGDFIDRLTASRGTWQIKADSDLVEIKPLDSSPGPEFYRILQITARHLVLNPVEKKLDREKLFFIRRDHVKQNFNSLYVPGQKARLASLLKGNWQVYNTVFQVQDQIYSFKSNQLLQTFSPFREGRWQYEPDRKIISLQFNHGPVSLKWQLNSITPFDFITPNRIYLKDIKSNQYFYLQKYKPDQPLILTISRLSHQQQKKIKITWEINQANELVFKIKNRLPKPLALGPFSLQLQITFFETNQKILHQVFQVNRKIILDRDENYQLLNHKLIRKENHYDLFYTDQKLIRFIPGLRDGKYYLRPQINFGRGVLFYGEELLIDLPLTQIK